MSYFYLDASALAKRYLTEPGSTWIDTIADPAAENAIVLAAITRVEVAAALAARHRAAGGITLDERDRAVSLLLYHCQAEYQLVPLTPAILNRAMQLTQTYRLRGYDAVQLATALVVHGHYLAAGLPGVTFVAADDDLLAAAHAETLMVENPNTRATGNER